MTNFRSRSQAVLSRVRFPQLSVQVSVQSEIYSSLPRKLIVTYSIVEYYLQTSSKAALKRIQRIVRQNVQRSLQTHHQATASTSTSQTQRMSEAIKQSKTVIRKSVITPKQGSYASFPMPQISIPLILATKDQRLPTKKWSVSIRRIPAWKGKERTKKGKR